MDKHLDKYERMLRGGSYYDINVTQITKSGIKQGTNAQLSDDDLQEPMRVRDVIRVMELKLFDSAGWIAEDRKWTLSPMNGYQRYERGMQSTDGEDL
jgi:hypothetical protein